MYANRRFFMNDGQDDIGLPDYEDDDIGLPDDDEDIGIPLPPHHIQSQCSYDDLTGLEDDEEEFSTQSNVPSSSCTGTMAAQHPREATPPPRTQQTQQLDTPQVTFNEFVQELVWTLASKAGGYTLMNDLKTDLTKDSGFLPDYVAVEFGFANFETLLKSKHLEKWVDVQINNDNQSVFLPRSYEKFQHIRGEQEISYNINQISANREEQRKYARAFLPENRENTVIGRRTISEILYELGAETKPISWQDVQRTYKEKYDVELAGVELKRMFQRDKALSIVETIFSYEVELHAGNLPGHFFLKLKHPFEELREYYAQLLTNCQEATAMIDKNKRRGPSGGGGTRRKANIYPVGPLYSEANQALINSAQPSRPLQPTTNNKTVSFGGVNGGSALPVYNPTPTNGTTTTTNSSMFGINIHQQQNNTQLHPSTSQNVNIAGTSTQTQQQNGGQTTTKSKFNMSDEDFMPMGNKLSNFVGSSIGAGAQQTPQQQSKKTPMSWGEEGLEAYDPNANNQNTDGNGNTANNTQSQPNAAGGAANANSPNGVPALQKKKKWTDGLNKNDYTDSEDEGSDDDNATLTGHEATTGTVGSILRNQRSAPANSNIAPGPRLPPVSCHQRVIQDFMVQRTTEKKAAGGGASNQQQQQQRPLAATQQHQQQNTVRNRVMPQRNNFSSSDTEMEEEIGAQRQQPAFKKQPSQQPQQPPATVVPRQQQPAIFNGYGAGTSTTSVPPPAPSIATTAHSNRLDSLLFPERADSIRSSVGVVINPPAPTVAANWALTDYMDPLRAIANRKGLSHESRMDEGTFTFRKGNTILSFTEFGDKVRSSTHAIGRIVKERYYPKVDWEMFSQTVNGVLDYVFFSVNTVHSTNIDAPTSSTNATVPGDPEQQLSAMLETLEIGVDTPELGAEVEVATTPWGCPPNVDTMTNQRLLFKPEIVQPKPKRTYILPQVPEVFTKGERAPPFPAYRKTVDDRDFLCFFTKIYAFSNHYGTQFEIDRIAYCCSEQYYMCKKAEWFGFEMTAKEIMESRDSGTIKRLGNADTLRQRQQDGLEPKSRTFDHDHWRKLKVEVMKSALRGKFEQNIQLYNMLIETGDAYLIEASPSDLFWGIGCHIDSYEIRDPEQWRGENWMGRVLMELRSEFHERIREARGAWRRSN